MCKGYSEKRTLVKSNSNPQSQLYLEKLLYHKSLTCIWLKYLCAWHCSNHFIILIYLILATNVWLLHKWEHQGRERSSNLSKLVLQWYSKNSNNSIIIGIRNFKNICTWKLHINLVSIFKIATVVIIWGSEYKFFLSQFKHTYKTIQKRPDHLYTQII